MKVLSILELAHTDRVLRPQLFEIGSKMGLSRKEVKAAINEATENGLKSRLIIVPKLDENYMPYNHQVTEYYI